MRIVATLAIALIIVTIEVVEPIYVNQLAAVAAVGIIFPTLPAQMDTAVPQIPVAPDSLPTFIAQHCLIVPAGDTEVLAIEGAELGDWVLLVAEVAGEGVPHLESPPTKYST